MLLERYARLLTRYAWFVLLAVALVTAGLASGIRKLRTDFNFEGNLPQGNSLVEIDRKIRSQFGGRYTVLVLIVPRTGDVWHPEVLEVVRDVTMAALRLKNVIAPNVVSLAAPSVRYVENRDDRIDIDYLMRQVPQTPEEIAALRAKVEADPQLRGMLVTPDNRAAVVVLDFWGDAGNAEVARRVLTLAEPYRDRPIDFYFGGEPMFGLNAVEQSRDVGASIPFTFLVIALMLLASFRNLQGMFIPMLTAVLSMIWGLGLMGFTGFVINAWNVATPILVIAVAAGHSAQMLKRYTEEVARLGNNRAAVVASTVSMGPVMVAAGGVASLGFASLALTRMPTITAFGLSCAYGIGSAVFLEMTLIPALRAVLPAPRGRPREGALASSILRGLEHLILYRRGRRVLVGTAAGIALAIAGIFQIRTYGPTREYMPKGTLPRDHLEAIEKHFPGTVTMTILYEGNPGDTKRVAVLKHMDALGAELRRHALVWRTASVVDLVKSLHKALVGGANAYKLPDDQQLVTQLVFLGASPAFERFVDRAESKAVLVAYLRDDDSALVGPLLRDAQAWVDAHPPPPGVRVLIAGGVGPTVLAVNEHTTKSKVLNMLGVLVTIYAVSSLVLRSPLGGLYVVTPIVAAVLALFGILGWTGIRLDMGSSSIIAMAAGVGADYAIYFLYRFREERRRAPSDAAALTVALQTSGRAVLFVAASISAGFAVMSFSRFLGLRLFGTLMPAAMVFSCLAALSIMPVLVLRARPRFLFDVAPTEGQQFAAAAER